MSDLSNTKKLTPLPLVLAVSTVLLTACNGGGFSNSRYIEVGVNPTATPQPPTKDDAQPVPPNQNSDTLIKPLFGSALSAVMPIPKRKRAVDYKDVSYFGEHEQLSEDALEKNSQKTLADLTKELKQNYDQKNKERYKSNFSEEMSPYKKPHDDYKYVKTGWIFSYLYADESLEKTDEKGKKYRIEDGDGYVYYYAEQPTIGRTMGNVQYTGSWDFVTDAKRDRRQNNERPEQGPLGGGVTFGMDKYWGDYMGATSFAETSFGQTSPRNGNHQATFQANFDDKTLKGTLSNSKQQTRKGEIETKKRYEIDATIQGNRFSGSARAVDRDTTLQFFQKDATNRLEGGFFGPNAEELGGRFLTDDNSVFGVFSGKQTENQVKKLEVRYDGLYVDTTQDSQINPAQKATMHSIANFGNVNQLQIGSQFIELLPNDHRQKIVQLASGQKAVVTSFGTTDGLLRLGSFNRAVVPNSSGNGQPKPPANPGYSESELQQAKNKLQEAREEILGDVENELNEYLDSPTLVLKAKITKKILSAFTDVKPAEAKLAKLFGKFEYSSIEEALGLMRQGDRFDPDVLANLQKYLPKREVEPQYSEQVIDNAKADLKQKINTEKRDLIDLINVYILLSEDDGKQESKQEIITKVLEAYTNNKHQAIKQKLESLLDEQTEGEVNENHEIVKLFVGGDKFDLTVLENLKEFLPKPDANSGNGQLQAQIAIDDSVRGFYLLGDRTPSEQIPSRGEVSYSGTWHGRIGDHWQTKAGEGAYASKANFNVNFDERKLTGQLIKEKDTNPVFQINANIVKNGFEGTLSLARRLDLDPGRQQNNQILQSIDNSKVQGGFYGKDAKHLAGIFSFEGKLEKQTEENKSDTVVGGGVFYGTSEQVNNKEKK